MAYNIEDEDGHINGGPCINGLRELKTFFAAQSKKNYPALLMFLTHGATHLIYGLGVECRTLATKAKAAKLDDVASTLTSLSKDCAKAKGVIMLTA